jgi:hypothetical protein
LGEGGGEEGEEMDGGAEEEEEGEEIGREEDGEEEGEEMDGEEEEGDESGGGGGGRLDPARQAEEEYRALRHASDWAVRRRAASERNEGAEAAEFRGQLEYWAGRCVVCGLFGDEEGLEEEDREDRHEMRDCPGVSEAEWEEVLGGIEVIKKEVWGKRRLERFSGCFNCGVPQELCDRWISNADDGGRFAQAAGRRCQYGGVIVRVMVGIWTRHREEASRVMGEMMERDGVDKGDMEARYKWFGRRIKWGGMEANKLCYVFHRLCKLVD